MKHPVPATPFDVLLGQRFICRGCGAEHHVPTEVVDAEPGAAGRLGHLVGDVAAGAEVLVVGDVRTLAAGAVAVGAVRGARVFTLPDRGYAERPLVAAAASPAAEGPRADEETVRLVGRAMEDAGARLAVAVGAGTVNDLVKAVSTRAGVQYCVFATAPSMNGYPSSIAALEVRGLKRTLPARPPIAIFAEPEVLAASPADLRRAGLGDLASKPVSGADWRLATMLDGGAFCPYAIQVVEEAYRAAAGAAGAIGRGEPDGVAALFNALVISGISMVLAGSSSPASGGEHLVSHWLDLMAHRSGRRSGLHGQQVGVATIASAALYREVLAVPAVDVDGALSRYRSAGERTGELESRYGDLAGEVIAEFARKAPDRAEYRIHMERLASPWSEIRAALAASVVAPEAVSRPLAAAGCPTTPRGLGRGDAEFREALIHGREIRGRYTVLDLADDLGVLAPFAASWPFHK